MSHVYVSTSRYTYGTFTPLTGAYDDMTTGAGKSHSTTRISKNKFAH